MTTPTTLAVREQPRLFWLLAQVPTQAVLFLVAISLTVVTACVILWRLFNGQDEGDIGQWLAFLGALLGIERLGFAAKRATAWQPPSSTSGIATAEPINEAAPVIPAAPTARRAGVLTPLPEPLPRADQPADENERGD
jgi:hypothetical protein